MRGHLIVVILAVAFMNIALLRTIGARVIRYDRDKPAKAIVGESFSGRRRVDTIKGITLDELMNRGSPSLRKLDGGKFKLPIWKTSKVSYESEEPEDMCDPDCDPEDPECDDDDEDDDEEPGKDRPAISE